jgi:hypothetical protein
MAGLDLAIHAPLPPRSMGEGVGGRDKPGHGAIKIMRGLVSTTGLIEPASRDPRPGMTIEVIPNHLNASERWC